MAPLLRRASSCLRHIDNAICMYINDMYIYIYIFTYFYDKVQSFNPPRTLCWYLGRPSALNLPILSRYVDPRFANGLQSEFVLWFGPRFGFDLISFSFILAPRWHHFFEPEIRFEQHTLLVIERKKHIFLQNLYFQFRSICGSSDNHIRFYYRMDLCTFS